MILSAIAAQVGLSERMVRRYIVALGISPVGVSGQRDLYDKNTPDLIRKAVLQARASKADAVRASIAARTSKPAPGRILTVEEAKRKGGGR
jgi:hypothetical protein